MHLLHLPFELLEAILISCEPLEVAVVSQTCTVFRSLIYPETGQAVHIWQTLFLAEDFDDPRICVDKHGRPIDMETFNWGRELRRRIVARNYLATFNITKGENRTLDERCAILHTVLDVLSCVPNATALSGDELSKNLAWGAALLRLPGGLLTLGRSYHGDFNPISEEAQLVARLHTYFGLTQTDRRNAQRLLSQAYVYDMRRYKYDNDFGPFLQDGSGRVNWVHVRAIHHVMACHLVVMHEEGEQEVPEYTIFPMSLPYCQPILPPGLDLDFEQDWAGIEGVWQCAFCFIDHRQLLVYNNFNLSDEDLRDPDVLGQPELVEVFRLLPLEMRIVSAKADLKHPHRPELRFFGAMNSNATMNGTVRMTDEGEIRWKFQSGGAGNSIWSSEGIQIGSVRSAFGVLGSWTTVFHDGDDPLGPFWLRKVGELDYKAGAQM